ncbi:MAG TPA: MarR family winged helix-turn-helix transcriptional regulator [Streptosporangiaceae bacterium]|nr:MarR family winged helix-turn-helix transcriptional regulator [Streptosporangiaceae bacterium]
MTDDATASTPVPERSGFAFLLVQLGMEAARQFAEQLAPLGVEPRHVGMLSRLAANEGKAQQVIGELIGLNPTQMVFLVDELEGRGFVERRRNPADRRSYGLYLTPAGRDMLAKVQEVGRIHQAMLGASLSDSERQQLTELLRRIARDQGISGQSLPGIAPRRR